MTVKYLAVSTAIVSVGLLAACGGSGTGSASFEDLSNQGTALVERLAPMDVTESMPTVGTATYTGVAAYGSYPDAVAIVEGPEALSRVRLTADFADESISGRLDNFRSQEGRMSGRVDVSNGRITGSAFSADLSGSVTFEGDTADITGNMIGGFLGENADAVAGEMSATADGEMPIYGIFGAER